jgi:hypothetical protein
MGEQVLDDVGRPDTGQRTLPVAIGRRIDLENGSSRGKLQLADRCLLRHAFAIVGRSAKLGLKFANVFRYPLARQPLPHRQQGGAADLTRPRWKIAVDEKRFERAEHQSSHVFLAPRRAVTRAPRKPTQLLQHNASDAGVFAPFYCALELPHQQ